MNGSISRRVALGSLLAGPLLTATPWRKPALAAATTRVVVTTGMIADVVRNIAGDRAEVTQLMSAGVDPHLYKATRSDVTSMLRADLVLYNGLHLEGKLTDALERAAGSGRKVYAVTERIDAAYLLRPPEFAGVFDPHVWMDPDAWATTIEVIRDALTEVDPEGAPIYAASAERYRSELRRLDDYAREVLRSVPERSRILVTAHDAFNYLGRRYALEVAAIQGLSTESEAGLQRIEALVQLLVERTVPAVFVESTIPPRTVEALVAGAAARGHTVRIGGELFSDAMGPPDRYEGTYVGMIDHNVTTIARALGGTVPDRGLNGRLEVI